MKTIPASVAARLHLAAGPIARRGLDQTEIDDLVAASGIPRVAFDDYFAGKEDVLGFLLGDLLDAMAEAVSAAAATPGRPASGSAAWATPSWV